MRIKRPQGSNQSVLEKAPTDCPSPGKWRQSKGESTCPGLSDHEASLKKSLFGECSPTQAEFGPKAGPRLAVIDSKTSIMRERKRTSEKRESKGLKSRRKLTGPTMCLIWTRNARMARADDRGTDRRDWQSGAQARLDTPAETPPSHWQGIQDAGPGAPHLACSASAKGFYLCLGNTTARSLTCQGTPAANQKAKEADQRILGCTADRLDLPLGGSGRFPPKFRDTGARNEFTDERNTTESTRPEMDGARHIYTQGASSRVVRRMAAAKLLDMTRSTVTRRVSRRASEDILSAITASLERSPGLVIEDFIAAPGPRQMAGLKTEDRASSTVKIITDRFCECTGRWNNVGKEVGQMDPEFLERIALRLCEMT
ncbi:hypothetical protein NL676_007042 [Syzygium grande]|nr:hypothetical protein NL676_007042 [Syzygium grande]